MAVFEDLIRGTEPAEVIGNRRIEVGGITYDSRVVEPGMLFAAIRGEHVDGHAFLASARERGAAAAIAERREAMPAGLAAAIYRDSHRALGKVAANFYGNPARAMRVIGITGTNGKTTTAYLIESILARAGARPGLIGTVLARFPGVSRAASCTTPEASDLQRLLAEMRAAGTSDVVMEVSSHALKLGRVSGAEFDVGIFTNVTRDHLDFHGTLEDYLASKLLLFTEQLGESAKARTSAVVNLDDPHGETIAQAARAKRVLTYGLSPRADLRVVDASVRADGLTARLATPRGSLRIESRLVGHHNLQNCLAAAAAAEALGIDAGAIAEGIAELSGVPGRLERVPNCLGIDLFVDYAHTDDALENVLGALGRIKRGRILTVFGCGGDRDRTKRPAMGIEAWKGSDIAIVSSDNPRTEDPVAIIEEIECGLRGAGATRWEVAAGQAGGDPPNGKTYLVEPSRRDAIRLAVRIARPGDTVLIAGKGHEDYQILGTRKVHFDDREEARAALEEREGAGEGRRGSAVHPG